MTEKRSKPQRAPRVTWQTALKLWTIAGGRCSFPGCNKYLLRDDLTQWDIKQGHIAHIVAARQGGPRGDDPLPLEERSHIDNLILVCRDHHSLMDSAEYAPQLPKELLLQYKKQHEERVYELTTCSPDKRSRVIRVRAKVQRETVSAPYPHICEALFQQGRFPREATVVDIDLTQHPDGDTETFLDYGVEVIRSKVEEVFKRGVDGSDVEHVSVFAVGPIPLLVFLGSQLSNKVPTDLYQRHRDTEDWQWKPEPGHARYVLSSLRLGSDEARVALVLSLSGKLVANQLPKDIDDAFSVYEISLEGETPNPNFLQSKSDLERFGTTYQQFFAVVRAKHPSAETVHLFPAIPAPVAVVCGRELLHKIPPSLQVYDRSRRTGGFAHILEVR